MRSAWLWGLLGAVFYLAFAVAFGIFMAPCTAGCLAVTEMAHSGTGPSPAAIAFFATIAVVGFANGYAFGKRRSQGRG